MGNILDEILAKLKKVNANLEKSNFTGNNNDDGVPDIMNAKDISDYLRVNVNKAYELFHRGDFPSMKLGNRYIIPKNKFLEWLDRQTD
jgi:excisionase family DNA binding protein